jgi:RNA-directed DNA polymerase
MKAKGVSPKAAASCAYCGKGAWEKSNRPAMTRAYPPRWFASRLASLKALWHDLNPPQVSDQLALEF